MWCSPQFFAEVASTSSMSQLKTFIPLIWSTQCSIHKYTYHLHSPSLPTNLPSSGTQPLTTSSRGFRIAMWAPQWIPEKPGCQTHVVAFGVKETPFRTMCCFYSCRSCSSDTLTLTLSFITLGEKKLPKFAPLHPFFVPEDFRYAVCVTWYASGSPWSHNEKQIVNVDALSRKWDNIIVIMEDE